MTYAPQISAAIEQAKHALGEPDAVTVKNIRWRLGEHRGLVIVGLDSNQSVTAFTHQWTAVDQLPGPLRDRVTAYGPHQGRDRGSHVVIPDGQPVYRFNFSELTHFPLLLNCLQPTRCPEK